MERARIQLLRYISIFHFATLATPADAIYHKILLSRHSFLAKEAGSDGQILGLVLSGVLLMETVELTRASPGNCGKWSTSTPPGEIFIGQASCLCLSHLKLSCWS